MSSKNLRSAVFAKKLRHIRKLHRLTQTEFGERIGVSGTRITRYESGEDRPREMTIRQLCRIFSVDEKWLLNDVQQDLTAWQVSGEKPVIDPATLRRLLAALEELPESKRRLILERVIPEVIGWFQALACEPEDSDEELKGKKGKAR